MFSLKSYTALVTGASGTIGRGIALRLAQQGAQVIITGTNEAALEETASQIESVSFRPIPFICNLSCHEEVDTLFDRAESQVGKIDILVNNAGITRDNLAMRMKNQEWQDVIDVNLTAPFKLCRSAIKSMIKRRYGRIINISSVVATMGNPGQANYCAAKAGLIGMTKSLAHEVAARHITVNCIAPGFIDSPMTQEMNDHQREIILGAIPLKKIGTADDVAAVCSFLASTEAGYVTGQTIHVNGGLEMV